MAIGDRWTLVFTNDNVEATNYQMFGIESSAGTFGDVPKQAAQLIGYAAVVAATMASGTRLEELRLIPSSATTTTLVPFPVAEYAALRALSSGAMVAMTAYGVDLVASGNPLAPLGTSIVVSEYTTTGGPSGRGRHFLPFTNVGNIDAGGLVDPATRSLVTEAYEDLILNPAGGPYSSVAIDIDPVVMNSAGDATRQITNVKVQPVFSNLESRRR